MTYFFVSHNKQTTLFTEPRCVVFCVMFAWGRGSEDKQCFVMMLSVILRRTLLQVQSGDNNTLRKHTHSLIHWCTLMELWNETRISNLCDTISLYLQSVFFPCSSLGLSHTQIHTRSHTLPAVSQLSVSLSLVIDLCSGQRLMALWRARASLHTNSVNRCSSSALKSGLWSKNFCFESQIPPTRIWICIHGCPPFSKSSYLSIFEHLSSNCSHRNALRGNSRRLLLHVEVSRCECVHLYEAKPFVWSTLSGWIKVKQTVERSKATEQTRHVNAVNSCLH